MSDLELAFDTEPVVAWRVWSLVEFGLREGSHEARLAAIGQHAVWPPRRAMAAECRSYYHAAPEASCACGIWALKERHEAERQLGDATVSVLGEVKLWGRVVETTRGWRGQYAYPSRLIVFMSGGTAGQLERLYGVPVEREDLPERTRPESHVMVSFSGGGVVSATVAMRRLHRMMVGLWLDPEWPSGIARPSDFWTRDQGDDSGRPFMPTSLLLGEGPKLWDPQISGWRDAS